MEPTIKEDFRKHLPPRTKSSLDELEKNIKKHGCLSPLVVWSQTKILLDGHARYDICKKHDIQFAVKELSFKSTSAAKDWIDRNQLASRNLSSNQACLLKGKIYNEHKK